VRQAQAQLQPPSPPPSPPQRQQHLQQQTLQPQMPLQTQMQQQRSISPSPTFTQDNEEKNIYLDSRKKSSPIFPSTPATKQSGSRVCSSGAFRPVVSKTPQASPGAIQLEKVTLEDSSENSLKNWTENELTSYLSSPTIAAIHLQTLASPTKNSPEKTVSFSIDTPSKANSDPTRNTNETVVNYDSNKNESSPVSIAFSKGKAGATNGLAPPQANIPPLDPSPSKKTPSFMAHQRVFLQTSH